MSVSLSFSVHDAAGVSSLAVAPETLIIAGWTGRDAAAIEHHIEELAAVGVPRPSAVPLFYRASPDLLVQGPAIQALGAESSGEVEPVIVAHGGELWVTLGSDHTDRKVEAYSVAVSKQLCAKPIASDAWRLADVTDHWDRLVLRSRAVIDGEAVPYQEGPVAGIRPPRDLIERWHRGEGRDGGATLPDGTVMFCGTLGAIGGVRPASRFEMEIEDPVLGRTIRHAYDIQALPVVA